MSTSSSVHSQAFSFMSFLENGVDPRTGQYTVSVSLPELKSNWLCGPAAPLRLNFNPINILDSGFGLGWNLNLSQFTPHNSILALSTGETFKVTGSGTEPAIKEKKLDSFHFYNNQDGTYRVVHKSGLIEVLTVGGSSDDRVALPTRIYAPSGHGISLTYASFRGGQRLQTVSDAEGELLRINRPNDSRVELLIRPYGGPGGVPLARYEMQLNGSGWVTAVVLPTADKASWRFDYGNVGPIRGILCLHKVYTPVGGLDTIDYQDAGHPYPGGVTRPNLPRVTRHRSYPGFGQPMMEVNYRYTAKNFLGAGATVSWEEGMDPLYNVAHTYEYGTTATLMADGKAVRQVDRTYNRFHLLAEEKTTQDHCVKREATTYYAEDKPFEQQVPQFQLPRQVKTSWEMDNDVTRYREELAHCVFDVNGNMLEQVDPDGIRTVHTYYPKEASDGCPADPEGFVRSRKDSTVYPSPVDNDGKPAPTLCTHFRYTALEPLSGSGLKQWLVSDCETLMQVEDDTQTTLKHTLRTCHDDTENAFLHGRPLSQSETLNEKTTLTTYAYNTFNSVLASENVLEIIETLTGFDHAVGIHNTQKEIRQQQSLLFGLPVLTTDIDGIQTLTTYDALNRVIRETVTPEDPQYRAERNYRYFLTSLDGQQASQEVDDVGGITTRTRFDGLGRPINEERQIAAGSLLTKEFRQTYAAGYDMLGNLIQQLTVDWLDSEPLELSSRFEYNAWGDQYRVIGPDGTATVNDVSPFGKNGPIERTWQESAEQTPQISQLSQSEHNRFGKLDLVQRFDAQRLNEALLAARDQGDQFCVKQHLNALLEQGKLPTVGSIQYFYNGYGNCIQQNELLDGLERTTHYEYDVWERMYRTTLADKTIVSRTFAEHSTGELPVSLTVKPANAALPVVTAGEQRFDGLLRQTELRVGPRVERYQYEAGQTQVGRRITPANQHIDYTYNLKLTEQPTHITTPEGEAHYEYDRKTASLTTAGNDQGKYMYSYTGAGHLFNETWTDAEDVSKEIRHVSSLLGRPLTRSHTDGLDTVYGYDDYGRPRSATQGALQAEFEYNALGQPQRVTTRNLPSNTTLVTDLKYDTLGREIERTLSLDGQPPRTITQTWQDDDQLKTRHLQMAGRSLLMEDFQYDLRNRLIRHTCSGEILPKDAHGNAITRQTFRFDALDNIQLCVTTFANGQNDTARFTYASDDSCQLKEVTHTYLDGGYQAHQAFEYDANGNMLNDERGKRLNYDSQGRLLAVKEPGTEQPISAYRYDGHNHLISVREGHQEETWRYYQGYNLSHTVQGNTHTQYFFHGDLPLGEQQPGNHDRTLLLLTDASPSVIGESLQGTLHSIVYNAYGERSSDHELNSLLAFNSEVREATSGWYLLGRGYRAYNPGLMRFHSPDSLSPFGSGGMNPYTYCLGNPIAFRDPSGHRSDYSRRPGGPGYVDPVVEPKQSWWQKWLPVAGLVISALFAVAFTPFTGGLSIVQVVGVVGVVLSVGAVGVAVYATLVENDELLAIASWVGVAGSIASIGSGIVSRISVHLAAKAAAKEVAEKIAAAGGSAVRAWIILMLGGGGAGVAMGAAGARRGPTRSVGAGSGKVGSTRSVGAGSGKVGPDRRNSGGSVNSLGQPETWRSSSQSSNSIRRQSTSSTDSNHPTSPDLLNEPGSANAPRAPSMFRRVFDTIGISGGRVKGRLIGLFSENLTPWKN